MERSLRSPERQRAGQQVRRWLFLVGVLMVSLPGCGQSQAVVRGRVTYNSNPLTSGQVHLVGGNGPARSGFISSEGTYEIRDAPVGEVKAAVVSYKSAGTSKGPTVGKADPDAEQVVNEPAPRASAIPTKYNDVKTSGLAYTISLGRQTIDIELKD